MLLAASLQAWDPATATCTGRSARTCAAAAVACLVLGAAWPAPLLLAIALVILLSIPWGFAVARRAASETESRAQ